jgi:CheY-like chemotaxis protein
MDVFPEMMGLGSGSRGAETPAAASSPVAVRELLDALPLALAILDDNMRIVGLNQRMVAKIGCARDMCLGRPVRDIVPTLAAHLEICLPRLVAGETVEDNVLDDEFDRVGLGGGRVHSLAALRNEDRALAGVLWIARDDGPRASVTRSVPAVERPRILMAEDLSMNQQIIAAMLESAGYEVLTVTNGASAVDLVRKEPIDLILMDIEMPLMGGLEATRAIRALGHAGAVPVVAMTANQGPEQLAACRAAGMDAYLCKPVDRAHLLSTVGKWLKPIRNVPPERRSECDSPFDLGVLESIRASFGPERTQGFIHEVRARLEYVLLQLGAGADGKQLGDDLHSLVSMGGHLGLRDLSVSARALMTALRRHASNEGIEAEKFRNSAERALTALRQEECRDDAGANRNS